MSDPTTNVESEDVVLEELSRNEFVGRVRGLKERLERLEDPAYLKTLVRQVLAENEIDQESTLEEIEVAPLPIQQVTRLPDLVAHEQLTTNQYRAQYLWKNYEDFSPSVRDGRVVKAGKLRRILQAREAEDGTIHTSTVGRVMEIVVDFTEEIATVSKSKDGERRLFVPNDWRRRAEAREGR